MKLEQGDPNPRQEVQTGPKITIHRSLRSRRCPYTVTSNSEAWKDILEFVGVPEADVSTLTVKLKRRRHVWNTTSLGEHTQLFGRKITIFTDPFWRDFQYFSKDSLSTENNNQLEWVENQTNEYLIRVAAHEGKHDADWINKSPAFRLDLRRKIKEGVAVIAAFIVPTVTATIINKPLISILQTVSVPVVYGVSKIVRKKLYWSDPAETSARQAEEEIRDAMQGGRYFAPVITITPKEGILQKLEEKIRKEHAKVQKERERKDLRELQKNELKIPGMKNKYYLIQSGAVKYIVNKDGEKLSEGFHSIDVITQWDARGKKVSRISAKLGAGEYILLLPTKEVTHFQFSEETSYLRWLKDK